jgi:membrane protein insertase Oxa1/YidC/SpoIIIJ
MMAVVTWLFWPIVWVMESLLTLYTRMLGSTGLAILLLSATFSLALLPLQRRGARLEEQTVAKKKLIDKEVAAALRPEMTGEQRFEVTEEIYRKYGYHPIQAMLSGASFIASLPILISSVILFTGSPEVVGESFLFISDLGAPDHLLTYGINLLPFVMFGITLADANMRFKGDHSAQRRALLISGVLLLLVYPMPASLVLYWIGNGTASMVANRLVP